MLIEHVLDWKGHLLETSEKSKGKGGKERVEHKPPGKKIKEGRGEGE
jgi:hypothetical protein